MPNNGPQLTAYLGLDPKGFEAGLKAAGSSLSKWQKEQERAAAAAARAQEKAAKESEKYWKNFRKKTAALVVAVTGGYSVGQFVQGVKGAYDYGREMMNLSRATGVGIDKMSAFHLALEDSKLSSNEMIVAMRLMGQHILKAAEGQYESVHAFNQIGVSWKELIHLPMEEAFEKVGTAIAGIENPALRSAAAIRHFGDTGAKTLKLFARGGALEMAREALGDQANIVARSGEGFERISIRLSHMSVKIRGFFMGVAEQISYLMDNFTAKLHAMDFTDWGRKFAQVAKLAMVNVLAFFKDPGAALQVMWAEMKTFGAEFVNWFASGLVNALGAAWNTMIPILVGALNLALGQIPALLGGPKKIDPALVPRAKTDNKFNILGPQSGATAEAKARWKAAQGAAETDLHDGPPVTNSDRYTPPPLWRLRGMSNMMAGSWASSRMSSFVPKTQFDTGMHFGQGGGYGQSNLLRHGELRGFRNAAIAARSGRILASGGRDNAPWTGDDRDRRRPGETASGDRQRAKAFAKEIQRRELHQGTDNQLLGDIARNTETNAKNTAVFAQ